MPHLQIDGTNRWDVHILLLQYSEMASYDFAISRSCDVFGKRLGKFGLCSSLYHFFFYAL
jgi:hypothetical protein